MKNSTRISLILLIAAVLSSCGPSITATWKSPDYEPSDFEKIAVIAVFKRIDSRTKLEDALTYYLNKYGYSAVPTYTIMAPRQGAQTSRDPEEVRQHLLKEGFDAVLVVSLVDVDKDTQYNPGYVTGVPRGYSGFGGFYGYRYATVYQPGYVTTTNKYTLENAFYDLKKKDEGLIWLGQSELVNPSTGKSYANTYAYKVVKKMEEENVLKK